MHDQYVIDDGESKKDKWNRGVDLFVESVLNQTQHLGNVPTIRNVIMN